jgi:hypothetical protein
MNIAREIEAFFKDRCYHEAKFVSDYSGRFMFGRKCIGYICKPSDKYNIMAELSAYLSEQGFDLSIVEVSEDEMALDRIVYFPYLSL